MTEIIQGRDGFHLLSLAEVLDDQVEVAAASWAAPHIVAQPDLGWIVARYVEADKPNANGHIFPLDQLKASYQRVIHKPLNMLHRRHYVVGAFTAASLRDGAKVKIGDGAASATSASLGNSTVGITPTTTTWTFAAEAAAQVLNPHVETLAAFWRYAFPDEYAATVAAFKEGAAYVSMEAVPESMTCAVCAGEFPYLGSAHDSYCAHLLASPRAPRTLNNAHFVGGGIIIPPTRPGWGQADIRDIAGLIESYPDDAESIYEAVAAASPHLDAATWEHLMAVALGQVHPEAAFPAKKKKKGKGDDKDEEKLPPWLKKKKGDDEDDEETPEEPVL